MKIAIIADPLVYGPMSFKKHMFYLCRNLQNMGEKTNMDFFIIIPKTLRNSFKLTKSVIIPHYLPNNKFLRRFFKIPLTIVRAVKILKFCEKEKIDLIHIPFTTPFLFYLTVRSFLDIPIIQTVHGERRFLNLHIKLPLKWRIKYILTPPIDQILSMKLGKFARTITVSNSIKRNLIKIFKIKENKIVVIYHGVEKMDIPKNKKIRLPRKYIFHLSSYMPKKNVEGLLRAFALIKKKYSVDDVKLIIGGKQPEHVKKLASKLGIGDSVIFTGFIKEEDLPLYYKKAQAFVFPSFHESFGMPIIEAMVYGCPVITSNVYATKEIAGDAALLVNPYKIEEIANAIYKILSDKRLREQLKVAGRKRSAFFSWEKYAKEHMKAYMEALKCKKGDSFEAEKTNHYRS